MTRRADDQEAIRRDCERTIEAARKTLEACEQMQVKIESMRERLTRSTQGRPEGS